MEAYSALARRYDIFNKDVPYGKILKFYEKLFRREGISPRLILDLACGTGNMSLELARAGYEVIAADASQEMLAVASSKPVPEGAVPPVWLNQKMENLDLYGTVQAAVCCLDGINYVTSQGILEKVFKKVSLFLEPGGVFIFDINSPRRLESLDGTAFTRECDGAFCVWQGDYKKTGVLTYTLDLFEQEGNLWKRYTEYHRERAYDMIRLGEMLKTAGFSKIEFFGDMKTEPPARDEGRIFAEAVNAGPPQKNKGE